MNLLFIGLTTKAKIYEGSAEIKKSTVAVLLFISI